MPEIVITLLLAAHLLAMNVASAGPLAGAWLLGRGRTHDDGSEQLGRRIVRLSLAALLVGSLLGGGLLLLPNPPLRAALARFPANAYWYAGLELLFSAGCIGALGAGGEQLVNRRYVAALLAMVSATNLLYHFPPLMAVIGELAADPAWAADVAIDRAALLRLWWGRPEILALWAHFVLASLAVAPIAALGPWRQRDLQAAAPADQRVVRRLGAWALAATVLQIPVGLWVLASGNASARESMMGRDLYASLCFAGGVMAAVWLLQTLTALALGDDERAVRRAGYLIIVVTVLMSATLRSSRKAPENRADRESAGRNAAPAPFAAASLRH